MSTDKHWFQAVLEELLDDGVIDGRVHSYSGRGMYGKECLSLCPESMGLAEFGALVMRRAHTPDSVAYQNDEELVDILRATHTDSMGLDQVWYWPRVPFTS